MICSYHLLNWNFRSRTLVFTSLLALILAGIAVRPALAHARVEIGPYAVVVGWLEEPAIVGERNALIIEITEDEVPVQGVESTLDAELVYGGRTFRTNLNPSPTPGLYTAEIFPTVRGQYAVHLFGTIGDMDVDEVIEPEEVFPASRIQFPEPQPDLRELQKDMQAKMSELETQLQTTRLLAIVGIVVGILGVALATFTLLRRR